MPERSVDDIAKRLLARGMPAQWATEDESAVLSGMSPRTFREKRSDLEARGFPKTDPENGKRFIPAILDFWRARSQPVAAPAIQQDEIDKENWQWKEPRGHTPQTMRSMRRA